uniref:Uncharacterized protein n=1 Tax=Aegilops tauschii subsp. strangulata TaxID=200361 RepID=A0A453ITK8_AEGTS
FSVEDSRGVHSSHLDRQGSTAVGRNDGGFLGGDPQFFSFSLSRLPPFHRDVIIGLRARASACASASRRPRSLPSRRLLPYPCGGGSFGSVAFSPFLVVRERGRYRILPGPVAGFQVRHPTDISSSSSTLIFIRSNKNSPLSK